MPWVTMNGAHVLIGEDAAGTMSERMGGGSQADATTKGGGDGKSAFLPDDAPRKVGYPTSAEENEHFKAPESDHFKALKTWQQDAVERYVGEDYTDINNELRQLRAVEAPEKGGTSDVIQNVILNSKSTEDRVLYRGIGGKSVEGWEAGKTYALSGFVSASEKPLRAFIRPGGTVMEIKTSKGSKILSGFNSAELEHLLPHGTKLQVTGIKEIPYTWGNGETHNTKVIQATYLSD